MRWLGKLMKSRAHKPSAMTVTQGGLGDQTLLAVAVDWARWSWPVREAFGPGYLDWGGLFGGLSVGLDLVTQRRLDDVGEWGRANLPEWSLPSQ